MKNKSALIGLLFADFLIGFVAAIVVIRVVNSRPEPEPIAEDPYAGYDRAFERLPEHEALVTQILGSHALHSNVRVYFDKHNPSLCGRVTSPMRAIVLSERCAFPLRKDGRYYWFAVVILGHELGHLLNGHGLAAGQMGSVRPRGAETPQWEQNEADEFAGWVLGLLGASLPEARDAYDLPPQPRGFRVPPDPQAVAAVERGWKKYAATRL